MARASGSKRERSREAASEAVAHAGGIPDAAPAARPPTRSQDPFTGGLRRGGGVPLLGVPFLSPGPAFGDPPVGGLTARTRGGVSGEPHTNEPPLRSAGG